MAQSKVAEPLPISSRLPLEYHETHDDACDRYRRKRKDPSSAFRNADVSVCVIGNDTLLLLSTIRGRGRPETWLRGMDSSDRVDAILVIWPLVLFY